MATSQSQAMRTLHDEHAASLWAFCVRLTGNDPGRAQDVVQETLLRAWRHPSILEQPPPAVRSWLFTVARNVVIDEWRTRRSRVEVVTAEPPERPSSDDGTDRMLMSWMVADALSRLSVEHRSVLVECYYRGRSIAEAAAQLGIPEGTVKSRSHYALRALRLALEEMGVSA